MTSIALTAMLAVAPQNRVLVLTVNDAARAWPAVERRVRRELEVLGVEVVTRVGTSSDTDALLEELERLTAEVSAAAAVCVVRSSGAGRVRVWVRDSVTGKSLLREAATGDPSSPDLVAQTALRAVDLLQASFAEVTLRPDAAQVPTPPVVQRLTAPSPPSAWVLTASASLLVPFGVEVMGGVGVAASRRWGGWFRVGVEVTGAPVGGRLVDPRLDVRLGAASAVGWALVEPGAGSQTVWARLGLGAGAVLVWSGGTPNDAFTLTRAATVVPLLTGRLGIGVRLPASWQALLNVDLGISPVPVRVTIDDVTVATLGLPWLGLGAAIERRFDDVRPTMTEALE